MRARRRGNLLDHDDPASRRDVQPHHRARDHRFQRAPIARGGRRPARRHEVVRPTARAGRPAATRRSHEQVRAPHGARARGTHPGADAGARVGAAQGRIAEGEGHRAQRPGQRPRCVRTEPAVQAPDGDHDARQGPEGLRHQRADLLLPRRAHVHRGRGHRAAGSAPGLGDLQAVREHGREAEGEADREAPADVSRRDRQRRELRLRRALRRAGR